MSIDHLKELYINSIQGNKEATVQALASGLIEPNELSPDDETHLDCIVDLVMSGHDVPTKFIPKMDSDTLIRFINQNAGRGYIRRNCVGATAGMRELAHVELYKRVSPCRKSDCPNLEFRNRFYQSNAIPAEWNAFILIVNGLESKDAKPKMVELIKEVAHTIPDETWKSFKESRFLPEEEWKKIGKTRGVAKRKRTAESRKAQGLPARATKVKKSDPLYKAIEAEQSDLSRFKLEDMDDKRWDTVKDIWLQANDRIKVQLVRVPFKYVKEHAKEIVELWLTRPPRYGNSFNWKLPQDIFWELSTEAQISMLQRAILAGQRNNRGDSGLITTTLSAERLQDEVFLPASCDSNNNDGRAFVAWVRALQTARQLHHIYRTNPGHQVNEHESKMLGVVVAGLPNDVMGHVLGPHHYSRGDRMNVRLYSVLDYAVGEPPKIACYLLKSKAFRERLVALFGDELFAGSRIGPPKGVELPPKPEKNRQ